VYAVILNNQARASGSDASRIGYIRGDIVVNPHNLVASLRLGSTSWACGGVVARAGGTKERTGELNLGRGEACSVVSVSHRHPRADRERTENNMTMPHKEMRVRYEADMKDRLDIDTAQTLMC
jgi:hypothetical protein